MSEPRTTLKFLLDEGVPRSVGISLRDEGHEVIFLEEAVSRGSADPVVCAAAIQNGAILIAHDKDMKTIAQGHGIGQSRFRTLNLLKLSCKKPTSAVRVIKALELVVYEWNFGGYGRGRQLDIEILNTVIRLNR